MAKRINPAAPRPSVAAAGTVDEMRRRAELLLEGAPERAPSPPLPDTADPAWSERIVHELGVHQIELEMQNEQLRLTQSALEASRDRYVDLYERAPVGYVTLDAGGVIVEANREACNLLGMARPHVSGRRMSDFVPLADRPAFQKKLSHLLRHEIAPAFELQLERAGQRPCWVAWQIALVHDDGRGVQVRVALLDITERVHMQEDASRLAAIVSSSDDAIVGRDLDGHVTSWNDGAARLFGRPAGAMFGAPMDALVPERLRSQETDLLRRIHGGERVQQLETERLDAHGNALPLSISVWPVRDLAGTVTGSALIARDMRERQRADQALRERLVQLDVLSQAGQALILGERDAATHGELFERVADATGCDVQLNYGFDEAAGRLTLLSTVGLSAEQRDAVAAQPIDETLCGMAAEQRKPLLLNDLQISAAPQARWLLELGARCFAAFPLLAQGRLHGVAAFVSRSRDELREGDLQVVRTVCDQVSAMLERERLLQELHANERSLRRADRAKDDFIATLAHELRNPLAPIRNAVGILRHGDHANPQRLAWCRDIIERQVAQMTRLLEDLLDVSRVTRNKIELRRERLELMRAVEQALETTRPLIEARRHRLVIEPPDAPIVLYGDLVRLTQVFANLLDNAAKYTDPGGEITVSVSAIGSTARVGVRDSGIGIESQHLGFVFDMFAQLAPALDRAGGGLGIGLALTRGLVEMHGGHIEAYSAGIGRGSEFVVTLPVVPALSPVDAHGARGPGDEEALPSHRMLVVDDNTDAAQTLTTLLAIHGQQVRTVFNGSEALAIMQAWQPDVVVLDIGLPDLTGYEVCQRIRALALPRRPLLIACTGWGQQEDVDRAREAGFDLHLVKPVDPSAVLQLLARARPSPPHGA